MGSISGLLAERVAVKRAKVLTAEQGLIVETTRDCVVEGKECKAGA